MKVSPKQLEALELAAGAKYHPVFVKEDDGWHARWRSTEGENPWIDEVVRSAAITPLCADAENDRHETLHDAWMAALKSRTGLVRWDDTECAAFAEELREWYGEAENEKSVRGELAFVFRAEEKRFTISVHVPMTRRALKALGQSAKIYPILNSFRSRGGGLLEVELTKGEAEAFIRSRARELAEAGFRVEGVGTAAKIEAEIELEDGGRGGEVAPEAAAKLVVKVDGKPVTAEEIRFLLDQKSTLVFFRDHWIEVDRNILKEALRALERAEGAKFGANAALGFAMGVGAIGRLEIERLSAHGWLRGLLNELKSARALTDGDAGKVKPEPLPGFAGSLRGYQSRGAAWMKFLTDHGFGALLADDMGLGKTIQTIAWILSHRDLKGVLIVAPLTLIANWKHEIRKFAPSLKVYVHHGDGRASGGWFTKEAAAAEVTLTSYSLLVKDYRLFRDVEWQALVIDEAQAIKNPDTQAARAVRSLGAKRRIALTGTPVENSLADIWSIEEYLNPTFLGERKSFAERYVKNLSAAGAEGRIARLRHALEPFVLRRLKSDREIAGELGEKREIREYCALSFAQRREYEAALEDFRTGEHTAGDVFALLTELKLICDGDGKIERLCELLESIFAAGESALVFTQYAKIGVKIRTALKGRFGRMYPFLHGALSAGAREAEIAAFNRGGDAEPCAFILSLKAGGYGLNLVKATHVIHFDRWWNPAVENQATDRAHRIGQTRTVFVHSFITEGTLEEHIADLLEKKSELAGSLVESGEKFLREMNLAEFERTVSLS